LTLLFKAIEESFKELIGMVEQESAFLRDFYLHLLRNPPIVYSKEYSEMNMSHIQQAYDSCKDLSTPIGYNLGMNVNEGAGQRAAHVHVHVFPRYREGLGVANAMRKMLLPVLGCPE